MYKPTLSLYRTGSAKLWLWGHIWLLAPWDFVKNISLAQSHNCLSHSFGQIWFGQLCYEVTVWKWHFSFYTNRNRSCSGTKSRVLFYFTAHLLLYFLIIIIIITTSFVIFSHFKKCLYFYIFLCFFCIWCLRSSAAVH